MKYKILAAEFDRQIDHFANPFYTGVSYGIMSAHQGDIRWPVEAERDVHVGIMLFYFRTFGYTQIFRKQARKIHAQLRYIETMLYGEIGAEF